MVKDIQVLALDIDGVITDGTALQGENGREHKRYSFHDLDAVTRALRSGLKVVFVTAEDTQAVNSIAERFAVKHVIRGAKDKLAAVSKLSGDLDVSLDRICYVGDGDRDAPALAEVGLGLAPANATPSAKASAHRVLEHSGGGGAVAEAVSLIEQFVADETDSSRIESEMREILNDSLAAHQRMLDQSLSVLVDVAQTFIRAIRSGRKILFFGNGGSAAEAQHIAGELIGRFAKESRPWPALALSTDTSVVTAIANDWDYSEVFARQVRGLARPGDVVVGLTTSGKSPNVVRGLEAGRECGAITIAFTGADPAKMRDVADICFTAPATTTPRIQELSLLGWHTVCELVERELTE